MASFTVTSNGASASQRLTAPPSACLVGKVLAGASIVLEASADDVVFAPATVPMFALGVTPITIPVNWYVRVVALGSTSLTNAKVEVA